VTGDGNSQAASATDLLLAGGLAAAGPARRAVGLNPVRALQAE
jgi:hypothetical protein